MKAIFKREMKAYFASPMGYIIMAVMLFLVGLFFTQMFLSDYSNIAYLFASMSTFSMFIIPFMTMRLFSEEKRQKSDQLLFTAPIKLWKIVAGKFFAGCFLFLSAFFITLPFQIVLATLTTVNWLLYLSCMLGILLLGSAVVSIGVFISSLTESQMVSGALGLVVSIVLLMYENFINILGLNWLSQIGSYFSFVTRYNSFSRGVIDFSNIIFFLSVTVFFLFLTTRILEKKRWA